MSWSSCLDKCIHSVVCTNLGKSLEFGLRRTGPIWGIPARSSELFVRLFLFWVAKGRNMTGALRAVRARSRLLACLLVAAVSGGVLAQPAPAVAKPVTPAATSPEARAKAENKPVEIPELTSERNRVFANPNGSRTAELSARPVRVRKAAGWVAVDTTLVPVGDAVEPKAAPLPVRVSGGGTGPLFTVTKDGHPVSYGWPAPLPKPVLAKDIATYGEVLPGIDLKVRVTPEQVSYALVVKTREAAANPALRSIRLSMSGGDGLPLTEARMWDSRQIADATKRNLIEDRDEASRKAEDFVAAPRPGAKVAAVAVTVTGGEVSLSPDQNLLTGKDTVFPVIIDPPTNLNYSWTMINQRHPDQSYWSYDRDQAKVGYVEDYNDGWEKYRTILSFDTRPLRGKTVNAAQMGATLNHSYYDNTAADVYLVNQINPGTTWNNHNGGWGEQLASTIMGARNGPKYVEWKSDALLGKMRVSAIDWENITLGILAPYEGELNRGWKKFDPNSFSLRVEYNTKPDVPRDIMIDNIKSCVTGAGRPAVANLTPVVKAFAGEPDGNTISVQGRIGEIGADGKYDTEKNFRYLAKFDVPPNTVAQVDLGQLTANKSYWFFLVSKDDQLWGDRSPVCEFTVDTNKPDKKPTVASADGMYPNDGKQHGGVGKTGRFAFGSNGTSDNGVNDVVGYQYGLADPPTDYVAADKMGGSATIGVTPENRNMNRLFVRSVDRAGNLGPVETYQFLAGRGTDPIGQWNLDEKSGTTLADSSGNDRPATLSGGTAFTDSRTGGANGAVNFNGSTGQAATAKPVLSAGTNFSAAAWVRMNANGTFQTAIAQEGTRASGFLLQYQQGQNRWSFTVSAEDKDNPNGVHVVSQEEPRIGVWTHLAGTFDAANKVARLYVNGRKSGEATISSLWTGAGPLTVGRARWNGKSTDFWNGDIDDVRIWDRRIYESEIAEIVDQATLVGQWNFDDKTGADSSGYNRPLSLKDGPKWTDRNGSPALKLSGTAHGDAGKPVLRTDNSFTVAAWAKLDNLDGFYTVLSQDGNRTSPFQLQYRKTENRWSMCLLGEDNDTTACAQALSTAPPVIGEWVHLVGVQDVRTKQIRIYVNGSLAGTATGVNLWQANGSLTVGRSKWQGGLRDYVQGAVDDVRLYQGIVSDADILDLSRQ
ncbi:hypothetical protein D5S17_20975 [Pseudonocardiaceae bacterium YIM PH 21723]|nr:hypothetical protein D5S17_20975 [Pseudonocardiaceae bacterium YIM PH 21723]